MPALMHCALHVPVLFSHCCTAISRCGADHCSDVWDCTAYTLYFSGESVFWLLCMLCKVDRHELLPLISMINQSACVAVEGMHVLH